MRLILMLPLTICGTGAVARADEPPSGGGQRDMVDPDAFRAATDRLRARSAHAGATTRPGRPRNVL